MRDLSAFVAARRPQWDAMRAALDAGAAGLDYAALDALAAAHRAVLADFAWARTHFPDTELVRELRALAFAGHRALTPPQRPASARVWGFLRAGYPARFRASLPSLGVALSLMAAGFLLGLVLTTLREEAALLFVGADALEQVRGGALWTDELARSASPLLLAVQIFTNNVGVAIIAWAGGALYGLGTVYVLLYNGAMIGALVALTARYGLLDRLLAFIPAHGMLEMFLITVAGAAGLQLAAGMVHPGEHGRARSFAAAASGSAELVGGAVPWLVMLGLVEGFLSPLMGIPTSLKTLVGLALLALFLAYALTPRSA